MRITRNLFGTLAVVAALFAAVAARAQLGVGSGTNAVDSLGGNVQYAGNVLQPIMLAIILVMGAIGIYYRFFRKAKVGT